MIALMNIIFSIGLIAIVVYVFGWILIALIDFLYDIGIFGWISSVVSLTTKKGRNSYHQKRLDKRHQKVVEAVKSLTDAHDELLVQKESTHIRDIKSWEADFGKLLPIQREEKKNQRTSK